MTAPLPARDELLSMWQTLADVTSGERLFRTRRLRPSGPLDLRVGLRETDGAPCLVAVTEGVDTSAVSTFETGGLRLARARDDAGLLLVLSLEEPGRRDLFAAVCSDVLRSVAEAGAGAPDEILRDLADRLMAWRAFLRDQAGGLGRPEVIGIAGELVVLQELLKADAEAIPTWKAPDDGLYDFQRAAWALEVKGTMGTGSRLRISNLDQLDDAGLTSLGLAHVRFAEANDGTGLVALAASISAALPSERQRRDFRNALLRRGLPPDADEALRPWFRVAGLDFYRVSTEFPRLRRRDVAPGITEASYDLEVRALSSYAVAMSDVLAGFAAR